VRVSADAAAATNRHWRIMPTAVAESACEFLMERLERPFEGGGVEEVRVIVSGLCADSPARHPTLLRTVPRVLARAWGC